jgi:hypothetical protein
MCHRLCAVLLPLFLCGCIIPGNSYKWDVGFSGTISGLGERGHSSGPDVQYVGIHRHLPSGQDAVEVHLGDGLHTARLIIFCTIEQSGQHISATSESQGMEAWITPWLGLKGGEDILSLPRGDRPNIASTYRLRGTIDIDPILNGSQWEVRLMRVSLRTEGAIPIDVFLGAQGEPRSAEEHAVVIEGTFTGRLVRTNHVSI